MSRPSTVATSDPTAGASPPLTDSNMLTSGHVTSAAGVRHVPGVSLETSSPSFASSLAILRRLQSRKCGAPHFPSWGYTRIRDALPGLKSEIGRTTVANILAERASNRRRNATASGRGSTFLQSHWETLYACDFFSVEVLGLFGTVRTMVFFVSELAPEGDWMKQTARNLLDPVYGFLRHTTHPIHERDPLFNQAWTPLLQAGGMKCVPIPPQSPNCNPSEPPGPFIASTTLVSRISTGKSGSRSASAWMRCRRPDLQSMEEPWWIAKIARDFAEARHERTNSLPPAPDSVSSLALNISMSAVIVPSQRDVLGRRSG